MDEAVILLKTNTEKHRFSESQKPFSGKVTSRDFKICRRINYRSSFVPVIYGTFRPAASGTKVTVIMRLNLFACFFCLIASAFLAFIMFLVLVSLFGDEPFNTAFVLAPPAMMFFIWVLVSTAFWYEAKKAKASLLDIMKVQKLPPAEPAGGDWITKVSFAAAFLGLIGCLVIHALTFSSTDLGWLSPAANFLFIAVFLIWLETVFFIIKVSEKDRKLFWLTATRNAPFWSKAVVIVIVTYCFLNFFLLLGRLNEGSPEVKEGKKVLDYKGRTVRELTNEEFRQLQSYELRLLSGHTMVFYAVAAIVLYSGTKEKNKEESQS